MLLFTTFNKLNPMGKPFPASRRSGIASTSSDASTQPQKTISQSKALPLHLAAYALIQPKPRFGQNQPLNQQNIAPHLSAASLYPQLPAELQVRLDKALEAALKAGQVVKQHFLESQLNVARKAGDEPVTIADTESDEVISKILSEAFPTDRLLTEEQFKPGDAILLDQTWVVDPLDATRNFSKKIPHFAISIAFAQNNQPTLAVVYDPIRDELFTAAKGHGVRLNGRPIAVSTEANLKQAVLSFPSPLPQKAQAAGLPNRRLGCAALDMAYVATGRLDAAAEQKLKIWDILPGILFVEEAGGKITDFENQPLNLTAPKMNYLATNGTLHNAVQGLF
jgi:myo-inositol-1(or 4)-monophosphatase